MALPVSEKVPEAQIAMDTKDSPSFIQANDVEDVAVGEVYADEEKSLLRKIDLQ